MTDLSSKTAFDPVATEGEAEERRFRIAGSSAGRRLDVALAELLEASRGEVRRLLARGGVMLDGRLLVERHKGRALAAGQELVVRGFRPRADQRIEPEPGAPLDILAQGEGWLVVDKRAGVAVHPLREGELGTVLGAVAARHPEVQGVGEGGLRSGVVHRLDVGTSGCLVVATEAAAWERLREGFRSHRVEKAYRAIALGELPEACEVALDLVVTQHRPARVRAARPGERGAFRCETGVTPLAALEGATLVELRPRTGFLHQIRATLAHLGHPLAGDPAYGAGTRLPDPSGATRCLLHAARVRFEDVEAVSPDPGDFEATLCELALPLGQSGA